MLLLFVQTIKCLLIVPNPESALNSEAGKMLLEHYDDYCKRAKMMTEIHASKHVKDCFESDLQSSACCSKSSDSVRRSEENPSDNEANGGPFLKKHANDKSVAKTMATLTQKKSNIKDKKRTLKRL